MKKNIFDSKYVTKKKSGVSSSFLMVFMAVLGVFIMMIMDVNFNTNHNRIRKVTQIERADSSDGYGNKHCDDCGLNYCRQSSGGKTHLRQSTLCPLFRSYIFRLLFFSDSVRPR